MRRLSVALSLTALAGACYLGRRVSELETSLRRLRTDLDAHARHDSHDYLGTAMRSARRRQDEVLETVQRADGSLALKPPLSARGQLGALYLAEQRAKREESLDSNRHTK